MKIVEGEEINGEGGEPLVGENMLAMGNVSISVGVSENACRREYCHFGLEKIRI